MDRAIEEARNGELRALVYLADAELANSRPSRFAEKMLIKVDEQLERSGYGQDYDDDWTSVLRRRWWGLTIFTGHYADLDLLQGDTHSFRSAQMHNEIRQLTLLVRTLERKIRTREAMDVNRFLRCIQ